MPPFALPRLPAPTASRLTLYATSSAAAAALVVLRACALRPSAFAVGVGLAKDSTALMVLGNLAVCVSLLAGIALQRLFFGRLRPIEVEHLYDKAWYFLTESLLAFTMFREDFNLAFLGLFGALLALKCFHWIAADRIDYLDQLASPPRWTFHLRLLSLLLLVLLPLDGLLLSLTAASLLDRGISGRIVFVSEFAVLLVSLGGVAGRYAIWAWDQWKLAVGHRARRAERARRSAQAAATADAQADADADVVEDEEDDDDDDEDVWEGKSMALFYLDLTTDFLKLTVYLLFFILVLANYGLPFNILRDLYLTSRSFLGRLRSLVQYRAATRDMELRYADATAAEIAEQGVCIICREEMRADDLGGRRAKRLGCGHAFHLRCLRMWLERQQSCPTCRRTVLGNQPQAAAPAAQQQQQPAAPPAPGATPALPAGGAAPPGPPAQGAHDRPLPPNVVRFGDRLAQHPPAPLNVPAHGHGQPPPMHGPAAAGGAGGGIFGALNPPQRFAHLFPAAAAPAGEQAPQQHPPQLRRPGAGIELNLFGLELDFHIGFGGGGGGGGGGPAGGVPAPAAALAPPAPLAPVQHAPRPRPTPTVPAGAAAPPPSTTAPAAVPSSSSTAAAPSPPESDRTRLLRELSAAMSSDESAAFTRILTKIVQDATRIEIGEELAHARRFDVREAVGRIVAALHDRPSQLAPTAALFPLVLGEADLSVVPSPTGGQGQRARLVDEDGTWVIDLGSRSALWTQPGAQRAAVVETDHKAAGDDNGGEIDEERMTPRDIAARAALRRSARLNLTPPPTAASNPAPTPTQASTQASTPASTARPDAAAVPVPASAPAQPPPPQSSRIVELDDQSVFFAIPPPAGASSASSSAAGPSTSSAVPASHASVGPSSSRPRVTLTPLHPVVSPTPLQQLVGSALSPSSPAGSHFAPLPTLPLSPTLSQADLDDLAFQTREAIEHRLAYIAHVDGVLGGLRAELSRVQQAVGRTPPPPPAPARSERNPGDALREMEELSRAASVERSTSATTCDRKGKGRADDAVGGVEPRDVPLPADAGDDKDDDNDDDDDAWDD